MSLFLSLLLSRASDDRAISNATAHTAEKERARIAGEGAILEANWGETHRTTAPAGPSTVLSAAVTAMVGARARALTLARVFLWSSSRAARDALAT